MPLYTDQLGRWVEVPSTPQRIVSVVPSQTELLYDLGLDQEVRGITKFCVHPEQWFRAKTRVGGTKQLHLDKIRDLKPDLILANKEENVKAQIEELSNDFPVWISDVNDLQTALEMIQTVGKITNKEKGAEGLIARIKANFSLLADFIHRPTSTNESMSGKLQKEQPRTSNLKPPSAAERLPQVQRTAYLIWKDPYMTIGGDTFIHDMLHQAGFENIFAGRSRYPETSIEELQAADCRLLLLSSEPYPFQQKHIDELQVLLPNTKILLVDGELFSWYGSRLEKAPAYFQQLQQQIQALSLF
jgi:ABC-type Fe3+-hydroxamate transport system substrate-binding protein